MSETTLADRPVYSTIANDPDMAELVEWFVDEIPERVAALHQNYRKADWDVLGRLAHQMKGAAGSYGFEAVTEAAAKLESAVRQSGAKANVRAALAEVAQVCGRVRAGTPA